MSSVVINCLLDTKKFDRQIEQVEEDLKIMERTYATGKAMGFKEDEEDLKKLEVEIEKTTNKLRSLKREKLKSDIEGFKNTESIHCRPTPSTYT